MGGCLGRQKPAQPLATLDVCHNNNNGWFKELPEQYVQSRPLPAIGAFANGSRGASPQSQCSSDTQTRRPRQSQAATLQMRQPRPPSRGTVVVAMFDYAARTEGELSFSAGDTMHLLDPVDADWWYVEHSAAAGECGYIPVALVAVQHSLASKSWFFGALSRKEAQRLLLLPGNCRGSFLVRESETHKEWYSLSVLDADSGAGRMVKHYCIRVLAAGACCITSRQKFASLQALIDSYCDRADGLCCRLEEPCLRPAPQLADLSYQTRDRWEISRSRIRLCEQLGAGQFGEVWRGVFNGATEVAVKMLKGGSMSREEFLKEARIMKRLRHRNLVQLFAVCTDGDPVYIVTELMLHGCLLSYLHERSLSLEEVVDVCFQVANGMAYLESQNFVHRDLAARNILVGDGMAVKVADFGLSRAIGEGGEYTAHQGAKFPIKWTSPEAALFGKFSCKSDVWSFGIVVFETVTGGRVPYGGLSNAETLQMLERGYRMPKPDTCPQPLYDLLLTCWHQQPERRPTFAYLREYFEDFFPASESNYRVSDAA